MNKQQQQQQPSLLKQWIEITHERYMTRKALRLLSKQEWSVDFLTALLIRAANVAHKPLEMTISNGNNKLVIKSTDIERTVYKDDSIFNHLDDELKVRSFINEVNRK